MYYLFCDEVVTNKFFFLKVCKVKSGVGPVSILVLQPLALGLHIIISNLMMLVLCGIAYQ